jgi:hypothetical protein
LNQYTNKRLAELSHKQAAKVKGSRGWRRLQRRRDRFLEQQRGRKRDMEHKISRKVVDWAVEREASVVPRRPDKTSSSVESWLLQVW